jgi:hypothetical protein
VATNPQAYHFSDILEKIRLRIVAATGLDDDYVRSVASDDYDYSKTEATLISIRPLGPIPSTDAGGGRYSRPFKRYIRVYISIRSSLDRVGSDKVALGLLMTLEDTIYNYCDDWFPKNDSGTAPMTIEPLHPVDASAGPPVRQAQDDIGELLSRVDFEVDYIQPNDRELPA